VQIEKKKKTKTKPSNCKANKTKKTKNKNSQNPNSLNYRRDFKHLDMWNTNMEELKNPLYLDMRLNATYQVLEALETMLQQSDSCLVQQGLIPEDIATILAPPTAIKIVDYWNVFDSL
jgi:hypothetical protein